MGKNDGWIQELQEPETGDRDLQEATITVTVTVPPHQGTPRQQPWDQGPLGTNPDASEAGTEERATKGADQGLQYGTLDLRSNEKMVS